MIGLETREVEEMKDWLCLGAGQRPGVLVRQGGRSSYCWWSRTMKTPQAPDGDLMAMLIKKMGDWFVGQSLLMRREGDWSKVGGWGVVGFAESGISGFQRIGSLHEDATQQTP